MKRLFVIIPFILINMGVNAQKNDTLAILREFVSMSQAYQQRPLNMQLEVRNSTNVITGEEDTLSLQGGFYLRNEESYIRFGEIEQIVNDSIALIINDKIKQMIIFRDAGQITQMLKSRIGLVAPDSSLRKMASKYNSKRMGNSDDSLSIELNSRVLLNSTTVPRETIVMRFDGKTKKPQQVITSKRNLIILEDEEYQSVIEKGEIMNSIVSIGNQHYLIREQVSVFIYSNIARSEEQIPVAMVDRIVKNADGNFVPVKKYEDYILVNGQE